MKKVFIVVFFLFISSMSYAQFGASFHQSNLPFVGFSYELDNRLLPGLRVGTDQYFSHASLELTLSYIFERNETFNAYAGIGGRVQSLEGLVVPVGLNIYPFPEKNFGFHMELAGLIGESSLLRGSWGIRYRFSK